MDVCIMDCVTGEPISHGASTKDQDQSRPRGSNEIAASKAHACQQSLSPARSKKSV
jgi:hypothetical protein